MDTSKIFDDFRADSYGKVKRPLTKVKALLVELNKERDLFAHHYGRWLAVNCTLSSLTGLWIFEEEWKEYTDYAILEKYKIIHNIK